MSLSTQKLINLWLPVILWCLVIFFFSSLPSLPSATKIWWDYLMKKSAHITEYAILYLLVNRALKHHTRRHYLYAFVFGFIYAISDELHQSFVPGRHPGLYDVSYDSLGLFLSYLYLHRFI